MATVSLSLQKVEMQMRKIDVTIRMTLNFVEFIKNKLTINFDALALIRNITAHSHLPSPNQLQLFYASATHWGHVKNICLKSVIHNTSTCIYVF